MRSAATLLAFTLMLLGCARTDDPATEESFGELTYNITFPNTRNPREIRLYLNGNFIGNVNTLNEPLIRVKEGLATLRAEIDRCDPAEEEIYVLGHGSRQHLHLVLKEPLRR